jgi:hypothetical protein
MTEEKPASHVPEDFDLIRTAESDPDFALALTNAMIKENPDMNSDAYVRLARFLAFKFKGVQTMREVRFCEIDVAEEDELRQYVNNDQLNWLELALHEFADIQKIDTEGQFKEALSANVDAVALIVERCRPGRVHAILGWTKLWYFGLSRTKPMTYVKEGFNREKVKLFLRVPFSFHRVFKSALAYDFGHDTAEREYISFMLLANLFSDWGPDDKVGDHSVGSVNIYGDGSYTVEGESRSPAPHHTDSERGSTSERPSEPKDQPKERGKKGFFSKFFG